MDSDLFLSDDKNTQIQTIREEIMVLFLERKLIPIMVKYKDQNRPYKSLLKKYRNEQMLEIIAHFITNLCGQGHSWLRTWCIDHVYSFTNLKSYNHKGNEDIAKSITKVDMVTTYDEKTLSFIEFINKGNVMIGKKDNPKKTWRSNKPDRRLPEDRYDARTNEIKKYGKGQHTVKLRCIYLENPGKHKSTVLEFSYSNDSDIIKMVMRKFTQTKYVYYKNHCIFDPHNNIGIINYRDGITLFRMHEYWCLGGDGCEFNVITMNLEGKTSQWDKQYEEKHYSYYYYSDAGCDGMDNEVTFTRRYLSTYGDMPIMVSDMFTIFAREYLDLPKDGKKIKAGFKIDGNEIYGDTTYDSDEN